jgi:hypothetical protein
MGFLLNISGAAGEGVDRTVVKYAVEGELVPSYPGSI